MPKHHSCSLPRLWLMTDERMGDALLPSINRLPKGAGVIFRHYSLPPAERAALLHKVERVARARRLMLICRGKFGGHGRHRGAMTAPVHSIPERIAAQRNGARLIFVSPVFPTTSHPGSRVLGRLRFGQLIRGSSVPVIALGGMTPRRARSMAAFGIYGWAAITSLTGQQP
jgi:thiamine-phosphate pyrophosphorylase